MNNKQVKIAATTAVGTLGAEALIGGLGVGLLGTAVAVPASLVVATVGTIAFFAAGDNPVADTDTSVHLLKKNDTIIKFTVNQSRNCGQTSWKGLYNREFSRPSHYNNLDDLRSFYKSALAKGYQPA